MHNYIRKFYLWGLIIIIVVALGLFIQHQGTNRLILQNVEDISNLTVDLLVREVSGWLNEKAQIILTAAEAIAIEEFQDDSLLVYLESLLASNKDYFSLYFGTPHNTMLNASGWIPPKGFDLTQRPWYIKATNEDRLVFTQAFINASQDDLVITVAKPVYSYVTEDFLGVVAGDISIKTILSVVDKKQSKGKGFSLLIDSHNNILSYPQNDFDLKAGLKEFPKEYSTKIRMMKESGSEIERLQLNDTNGYLSYRTIENTDWTMVRFTPLEEYTQIFGQLSRTFFMASLIALVILLVFFFIQRKYVIKPLLLFDGSIKRIDMENQLDYRLPVEGQGDFLFLTNSINHVLDKATEYFIRLNQKEKELLLSNHELMDALEQLTASEEEISAQYERINDYVEELEDLKQRYEIAIDATNTAVWEFNREDLQVFISRELKKIVGIAYQGKQDIYQVIEDLILEEDQKIILEAIHHNKNKQVYLQLRIKDIDGSIKWVLIKGKGVMDLHGQMKYVHGIILDITSMKEQEDHIKYLAHHDPLTELPNRRKFMEVLQESIYQHKTGVVMLLDLDNFKTINDSLGHIYGDHVLKKVSLRLLKLQDEKVFISRFGGDEFLILIRDENQIHVIEEFIDKLKGIFKKPFLIKENEVHIRFSMGVTLYPYDSTDINQLLTNADIAMYQVKGLGKNNHAYFNRAMTDLFKEKKEIEDILRKALLNEGFKLQYQPQVDIENGWIHSLEALLRLKDDSYPPGKFIPVAEETGLVVEMGKWVTKEVIKQLANWRGKGFKSKKVSINFSVVQLNDENFLDFLQETLLYYQVDPRTLEIEITESVLLERTEDTMEFLDKIKKMGISIALDDFGTSYSSLSYLTFVPVDKVKLDKSLNDKFLQLEKIEVMDSLIALIHSLDLEVTAEGIEDFEQYRRLKVGKCNYIQGFLFSEPLDVKEVEKIYEVNFLKFLNSRERWRKIGGVDRILKGIWDQKG